MSSLPTLSPLSHAERGTAAYRRITYAMFLAGLCLFAQLYFLQPLLPVLARYFRLTPARSSLVISTATLALAAGLLLGAFLANRFARKPLMVGALLSSSALTVASALVPSFAGLLVLSALKGFLLAGVAAIAMAYIGEEVAPAALSRSMGTYISGTILGGMLGRVAASLLAGWYSWRVVAALIGLACLGLAVEFGRSLPPSRHFTPHRLRGGALFTSIRRTAQDARLLGLCLFAALAMGSFVSLYNYLGFRLEAPPFSLSPQVVASIFLLYAVGLGGSFGAGPLAERWGLPPTLAAMALLMLSGLLLTWFNRLGLVIMGVGALTFGFFGAHTLASSWAGRRAPANRAAAASLYLLFYYLGSSVVGTLSGIVLQHNAWNGLVLLLGALLGTALLLALLLWQASRSHPSE
jgi:YNFM family putative membrane transporter